MVSVKKNASDKKNFERKDSKDGSHYFVLKAANSKVIGKSQMYTTKESMENGIESVRENTKTATVNYI
jgi:uncharacterized protein YegP (UPF0339 family)